MTTLERPAPTGAPPAMPNETGGSSDAELIIREARRRQRRRWSLVGLAILTAAATGFGFALTSGRPRSRSDQGVAPGSRPSSVPALVKPCASSDLRVSVGFVQGTAQHWLIPLTFTNVSAVSCTLTAYPTVSFVSGTGQTVGLPITTDKGGYAFHPIITLRQKAAAAAFLWEPDTTDLVNQGQACSPLPWTAIRVTSPASVIVSGSLGAWQVATTTCTTGQPATIGPLQVPNPLTDTASST